MSETHTPGPWYIGERTSYHGMSFIEIHSEAKIGRIKMPAHLLGPVARTDKENAALIAAAPDLLAALQEARAGLAWYQDAVPELANGSDDEAMARIDAAIAKAQLRA